MSFVTTVPVQTTVVNNPGFVSVAPLGSNIGGGGNIHGAVLIPVYRQPWLWLVIIGSILLIIGLIAFILSSRRHWWIWLFLILGFILFLAGIVWFILIREKDAPIFFKL